MNKKVLYYNPGAVITLFNYREGTFESGSLYFTNRVDHLILFQNKLIRAFATILLFISVFSITTTTLPIIDGFLGILDVSSQKKETLVIKKDPNTYSNNFILADENSSNEFMLSIPKINLTSEVIPNVDSSNEEVYKEQLTKGVAHASGSYFPGQKGTTFLFSHSTDTVLNIEQFNAKFFALKDLDAGDEIAINYKSNIYKYVVKEKKIINPDQLDSIRDSNSALILSTCFPPGTNWQRLIVYADLVKDQIN